MDGDEMREFMLVVHRALLMVVRWIERRYDLRTRWTRSGWGAFVRAGEWTIRVDARRGGALHPVHVDLCAPGNCESGGSGDPPRAQQGI